MKLRLVVHNTHDLDGTASSSAIFDPEGGIIGSGSQASWILADRQGSVLPNHLEVHHFDGQFCLKTAAEAVIYVNGSTSPIGPGEMFQVSDGDEVKIGIFHVSAYVSGEAADEADKESYASRDESWARRFTSVGSLVSSDEAEELSDKSLLEAHVMQHDSSLMQKRLEEVKRTDPIEMMETSKTTKATNEKDPMAVFEREQRTEAQAMMTSKVGEVLNIEPEEAHYVELPDDLQPGSSYVSMPQAQPLDEDFAPQNYQETPRRQEMPPLSGSSKRPLNNEDVDSYLAMLAQSAKTPARISSSAREESENAEYEQDWQRVADAGERDSYLGSITQGEIIDDENLGEGLIDHVVLHPLCAALGLNVAQMSQPQANRLAHDIGAALKAAISGLMSAHRHEISNKSHLAETHLHAIEDNPLRLDVSAETAIKDMFLVQSPVHLSAPAAISESLELLHHHRLASEVATEKALEAVLQALSPLALARRFMKYKGHAPRAGNLDAWHWTMYQHYYAEMRSDNQGGLSRMFWEVHRQIYDREMRQRTQTLES